MDPTAADDASDAAMAGRPAKAWSADQANDTLYRRPMANPPLESASGGSWFSGGTDMPELNTDDAAELDYGSAASNTSSRASFGFTEGPISPVRSVTGEVPIQRKSAAAHDNKRPAPAGPPAPAARQAVPSADSWSQPRFGDSPLDPVSSGAFRGPEAEADSWAPESDRWAVGDVTGAWATAEEPGGGRESGEHRAARREHPDEPERGKQSRLVTLGIVLLSTVVLAGGAAAGVVYFAGGSRSDINAVLRLGAADTTTRTVTAPLANRTAASFELLAGTNSVRVTIGDLGDDLYRISTPDDAGIRPSPVIRDDAVQLQVTQDGAGDGGDIEVVLAAKVRWALRFAGYAETQRIDVSGGQVSQIEMVAGMKAAEVTLPRPSGTVPLKINGAVDKFVLKAPSSSPVRIKVNGGAQTVVAGTRTLKDVAAGSTLTPKGWATADRYDVTAGARINALTIESA